MIAVMGHLSTGIVWGLGLVGAWFVLAGAVHVIGNRREGDRNG